MPPSHLVHTIIHTCSIWMRFRNLDHDGNFGNPSAGTLRSTPRGIRNSKKPNVLKFKFRRDRRITWNLGCLHRGGCRNTLISAGDVIKKITKPNVTIGPPKNSWDMQKKPQNYKLISPFFPKFTNNDLGLWREKSQNSLIEIPYCHTQGEGNGWSFEKNNMACNTIKI